MSQPAGDRRHVREVRIFVSSPGDVVAERQRLQRVADRLNGLYAGTVHLRCIRWEDRIYTANDTFQAQIESPRDCDIVVSIFWTRLGTELPADFPERLPGGRSYPSGTAYEVLTALDSARARPLPDVFVFRKTQRALYPDPEDEAGRRQFDSQLQALLTFWEEWFRTRAGHFRAAFNSFGTTDDFERQVERALVDWLEAKVLGQRTVPWRIDERGSPFRSLQPFEAEHAEVFFGRSHEVERGRERLTDAALRGTPFLLIAGASGSGKSSLARAGLIPRLAVPGVVDGVDLWRIAILRLGAGALDPLHDLAAALLAPGALPELAHVPNADRDGLARQLAAGADGATILVRWALDRAGQDLRQEAGYDRPVMARLVLLLDQFESLFAPSVTSERRVAFIGVVEALVDSGLAWTIATLRSTDYGSVQADHRLLRLKTQGAMLDLAAPDQVAIEAIVRGPAEAAGLAFERSTDGRRLEDVLRKEAFGTDALPLLQFTLQKLFEARQDREGQPTLTFEGYRALGGLAGAIGAEAERVVGGLPEEAQGRLPWLLRRLVANRRYTDQGTTLIEMTLNEAELAAHRGARVLIEALVAARVLVPDGGGRSGAPSVRVAHESVLRGWERARRIVEGNARYFQHRAELEAALQRWRGNSKDYLLRGTALSQAEDMMQAYAEELSAEARDFIRASRRAADRGRRMAIGAVSVMTVLLAASLVGGLIAIEQRNEAQRQRTQAERNFDVARRTADSLVFDLASGLRDVEGMRIAKLREILDRGEAAYNALASAGNADPQLLRSQAAMYILFSETYAAQGDTAKQIESANASLVIMRRLTEGDPDNAGWQRDLSTSLEKVGNVLESQGKGEEALRAYRDSLEIRTRLVKAEPGNAAWQHDLSMSFNGIGNVLESQGKIGEALQAYRDSLAIRQALASANPGHAGWQRDLSVSFSKVGDVLEAQGDRDEALKVHRDGLAIIERLARSDPGNAGWQRDLAVSFNKVGDVLVWQGKGDEALAVFRDALAIIERLARSDPGNAGWQRDLSVSFEKVGNVLETQGNGADALKAYRDGLAIADRLAKSDPGNARWQRDLSISFEKVGDVLVVQGKEDEALRVYRDSLVIRERLAGADPGNARLRFELVSTEWRLANRGDNAAVRWERIVAILRALDAEGRPAPNSAHLLLEAEKQLAAARASGR